MKTNITSILPFFSSLSEQEHRRYLNSWTRISPYTSALPFIIKRAHTTGGLTAIVSVDSSAVETDIRSKFVTGGNLISSWSTGAGGSPYDDAFVTSGIDITSAIQAHAIASRANSNTFAVTAGYMYYIEVTMTLNSGEYPTISLADSSYNATSNIVSLLPGANKMILTATGTGTYSLQIKNNTTTNFALDFSVIKLISIKLVSLTTYDYYIYNGATLAANLTLGWQYFKCTDAAGSYYSEPFEAQSITGMISISYSNTKDLGDIPYSHTFTQLCYLDTIFSPSDSKVDQIGDIRDGILIVEKTVQSQVFKIIANISNSLFQALATLPAHDTITITDDLGYSYTANNIEVSKEELFVNIVKVTIDFTCNELVSTANVPNMT